MLSKYDCSLTIESSKGASNPPLGWLNGEVCEIQTLTRNCKSRIIFSISQVDRLC